jgi:uncharacterized protein (DUF2384 family)
MKPNGSHGSSYVAALRRMNDLLSDLYTPIEAEEWLRSKHKMLGDQTPAELIAQGKTAQVEQLIEDIRDGAFL